MRKTLTFTLFGGMDSLMRVIGLLRRKGISAENISLQGDLLELSVLEDEWSMAMSNLSKLADVKVCA